MLSLGSPCIRPPPGRILPELRATSGSRAFPCRPPLCLQLTPKSFRTEHIRFILRCFLPSHLRVNCTQTGLQGWFGHQLLASRQGLSEGSCLCSSAHQANPSCPTWPIFPFLDEMGFSLPFLSMPRPRAERSFQIEVLSIPFSCLELLPRLPLRWEKI